MVQELPERLAFDRDARLRRRGTMPARRIDVLPSPDCPNRIVSSLR
jgi:hypothetical protein